jgi:hypothetical protein
MLPATCPFTCVWVTMPNQNTSLVVSNAFQVGDLIDSMDTRNMWLEAQVLALRDDPVPSVLIHYPQWSSKWDIWVACDSETIAPYRTHTTGPNINPHLTSPPPAYIGTAVTSHV